MRSVTHYDTLLTSILNLLMVSLANLTLLRKFSISDFTLKFTQMICLRILLFLFSTAKEKRHE